MNIQVTTSQRFLPEKKYVFEFILGKNVTISVLQDMPVSVISLLNGNELVIQDTFFYSLPHENSLLSKACLPVEFTDFFNPGFSQEHIGVLFGKPDVYKEQHHEKTTIQCNIDIPASVFFMLSRWEEYLPQEYDGFGRIKPANSTAVKLGFNIRPVVDEWRTFIWDLLEQLDPSVKRPQPEGYCLNPTHDVDILYYPADILNMLGDIKNTGNIVGPFKRIAHKVRGTNPYNTFDFLMDMSERNNVSSVFYFMANGQSKLDNTYRDSDPFLRELVSKVRNRNHLFGLHPGFETFNNADEFIRQKNYVENYTGQKITHNRQHYLRLRLPETLTVWEKAGIENDSSLGFTEGVGYRCGTGSSFPLFNVAERRTTKVIETPLVFMEVALRNYADLEKSRQQSTETLHLFKRLSQKYQTPFTFLFHNSSFDDIRWPGWQKLYRDFLSQA